LPKQGKSGGTRVVYIDFAVYGKVYLLAVFAKSEMENLSPAERNELKSLVHALEKELTKR